MLPFLGGSQREWTEVVDRLSKDHRCITIDLPGFGSAAAIAGYSVGSMRNAVIDTLSSLELERYVLIGHSMGGKVSAVVASSLRATPQTVTPPAGLVLVAPSPPGPEPMSDAKRTEMMQSLGASGCDLEQYRRAAEKYVHDNVEHALPEFIFDRTVDDVLVMNRDAWVAWLTGGSKEDFANFVGVLDLPALVVAGSHDASLGPAAQQEFTLPHFSWGELVVVDSSHLVPLEQPAELAMLITKFVETL